jgi:hypothetical protein
MLVKPIDVFDTKRSICQGMTNLSNRNVKERRGTLFRRGVFCVGIDTQGEMGKPKQYKGRI